MEKYIGKSVYKGTAIGPINVLKKSDGIVKRQHVEDVAAELQRLEDAKKQAQAQLGALYEKALQEVGEVNAQIFEVHQMMLEDEDYQDAIHSMIETEELNAEYAVAVTGDTSPRSSRIWMMSTCRHAQRMSGIFRTGWSVTLPERDRWTGVSSNSPLLLQMI